MSRTLRGKIAFLNEAPAAGVTVRVFDRDSAGQGDDDLTLTAGLSDDRGKFEVTYEPGRFRDAVALTRAGPRNPPSDWTPVQRGRRRVIWPDFYRPYLQFEYAFRDRPRQHRAAIRWFSPAYTLPQVYTEIPFSPIRHGYRFNNLFKGVALPFSIPEIPGLIRLSGIYGLCGGMAATAYDHYLFGCEIPQQTGVPRSGSTLQRYLYRRQMDTFGTMGEYILKFADWMKRPDDTPEGLYSLTAGEFKRFRARLENNLGSVLGLVYAKGSRIKQLFLNHQVLGYGLDAPDEDHFAIRVYDPNYPGRDDVTLRLERRSAPGEANAGQTEGLACEQWLGERKLCTVHGFFLMPYVPIRPPSRSG